MDKQKSFRWADRQQSFRERSKESPGKRGDTELHLAARAGNTIHVQRILVACKEEEVRNLICKQNQDGETAMYVAAEKGHADIVREMLKVSDFQSAAIKTNNSYDAFHIAAKQGHLEIIKDLLSSFSALAMTTNSMNSTPLDAAATKGHIGIVNLLLETDSSLAKIVRNNGKTALHSAARMGHVEVVKSLLDNDPTICLRIDRKGQTAFHMAVKSHNVDVVMELLKPDASIVNLEDSKGNTALHIATRKGNQSILKALLSVKGINVNAVNKTGETALSIAEKVSNDDIATLLREFDGVAEKKANPPNAAKQLKQTVSDIKHDVQSQLRQTQQTEMKVQNIRKKIQKLNYGALNNTINSNTVVAVLIATVAFAAIFQLPGQYVDVAQNGFNPGEAYIAKNVAFVVFLISDSLALFISLAVVVVQTSLIVVEQKAKKRMIFVMNKLMWLACISISVAFISITYIVIGRHDMWLAWSTMVIGTTIMLTILGCMCYCIIIHRIEEKTMKSMRRTIESRSLSQSLSVASDPEMLNGEHKKIFAL